MARPSKSRSQKSPVAVRSIADSIHDLAGTVLYEAGFSKKVMDKEELVEILRMLEDCREEGRALYPEILLTTRLNDCIKPIHPVQLVLCGESTDRPGRFRRAISFIRVAQAVLTAHNSFGNYAAEPEPTKQLAAMGTSIPVPALAECLRAYFCVYLGNSYGHSWDAASVAERELKRVSRDRWERYFEKVFPGEQDILFKLCEAKPVSRWIDLVGVLNFANFDMPSGAVGKLIGASSKKAANEVIQHASTLLRQFRGTSTPS